MQNIQINRNLSDGGQISVTIAGPASLDDMVDIFRGLLVQVGYHPRTAEKLQLVETDDENNPD
jgi:hypothetical protein